jgi:hypothetical protein
MKTTEEESEVMTSAKDALSSMGIDLSEAIEADKKLTKKPKRDNRICVCGHAVARHKTDEFSGITECKPSRMYCPCDTPRAVLEAEDIRVFLRQTWGPKAQHALIRGLVALAEADKEAKWIDDPLLCDKCQTKASVYPVPLTSSNKIAEEATSRNALLCDNCIEELR